MKKTAKRTRRPAIVPPVPELFLVHRRDGKMYGPFTLEGMAMLEQGYHHANERDMRPYTIVRYVIDSTPRTPPPRTSAPAVLPTCSQVLH